MEENFPISKVFQVKSFRFLYVRDFEVFPELRRYSRK